ncbi:cellulose synthase/poly-beta-1,6-N-acetylglucosamine synthase-like glycosyltransferase [Litorimonas taeanensis]|uniref:Cellulose synthase/poly-beta-1,6-N-acetylglucosamine synthase-like glycosyltransferase n=1 Tax=Litorimonas taeanensis TaxID=568099 RepID=A0A420WDQ0_9PROT|nr:glycosyltransferase [Litorimonas taeanensis]RKQ69147.1 cellulose synthase/poly-beta-1,6-N-acetylglucosamine synthase-like glycosyltransferase [Litorimonas taeanensis]
MLKNEDSLDKAYHPGFLTDTSGVRRANHKASLLFKILFWLGVAALGIGLFLNPLAFLLKLSSLIAWISLAVAMLRIAAAINQKPKSRRYESPQNYPKYSVLVPIFHEANMVESLMNNLAALDYPLSQLEIFIICEAVDPDTVEAVKRCLRPPFQLVVVPAGYPQTKPRALNYAMQYSTGEYITIYDAEDQPHPSQLKAALQSFGEHPEWAALQAPLDYYNADASWLSAQFTLEYAALFHVWIPFLSRMGIPLPLGGTSNHMRRGPLEKCGGWDIHNVTEDADLSFRLAALGYKIGYILPPTDEEAVTTLKAWHNQRARWMKGYMQTWLAHMHSPWKPRNIFGVMRFLSLQFTIAYVFLSAFIFTPIVCGGIIYAICHWHMGWSLPFSKIHFLALGTSLVAGILIGMLGAYRAGKTTHLWKAFLMPLYWLLLFWPTLRALVELKTKPFHWHKTTHGVSASQTKQNQIFCCPADASIKSPMVTE